MSQEAEWQRLCSLLDDDDEVRAAVAGALGEGEDGWQALLDALDEAGALAYLQTDDTGMELTDALAQLPRVVAAAPDLGEATDTDDLVEATAVAHAILSDAGLGLVRLVEDADAWPVVVVRTADLEAIADLARAVGHEAVAGG